jgi:tryptophan synthase alpha chain
LTNGHAGRIVGGSAAVGSTLGTEMQRIRDAGSKAFIPFLVAGFPDPTTFRALLRQTRGADFVEVGLPFSDPVADGPSICSASEAALRHGMDAERLFGILAEETELPPRVVMTYLNPVLAYGVEPFMRDAARSGVRGVILTDVPPEEGESLFEAAAAHDIATVLLVAPTTTTERMRHIAERATGFLYGVAVAGTTGARTQLGSEARNTVARLRGVTQLPVVVGFGISTPEQVRDTCAFADGAVVGSALVDWIQAHEASDTLPELFGERVAALAAAAHGRLS